MHGAAATDRLTLLASRQKISVAKLESNQPWFGTESHRNMAAGTSP